MNPAGLEPAIPGSVGRCLIHWATGPLVNVCTAGCSAARVATMRFMISFCAGVGVGFGFCVASFFVVGVDLVAVAGGCNYVLP
jgi:hypothetical protein